MAVAILVMLVAFAGLHTAVVDRDHYDQLQAKINQAQAVNAATRQLSYKLEACVTDYGNAGFEAVVVCFDGPSK